MDKLDLLGIGISTSRTFAVAILAALAFGMLLAPTSTQNVVSNLVLESVANSFNLFVDVTNIRCEVVSDGILHEATHSCEAVSEPAP